MKSKLRYVMPALVILLMTVVLVTNPPGMAKAGVSSSTAIPVGSTTPVIVVQAGTKVQLRVCNTAAATYDYCLATPASAPGTVSSTNWTLLLPAAASTAGTAQGGSCYDFPALAPPIQINGSRVMPDQLNCVSNGAGTMSIYYR